MSIAQDLITSFKQKTAKVGVIGLGYVGLPMAHLAAMQGFKVIGIDVDEDKVSQINSGNSYIIDIPTAELEPLVSSKRIVATTDYSAFSDVDVVLITVPTPLNKTGDPDMSYIHKALEQLQPYLHKKMMIALESTTYPGTTEEIFVPVIEDSGLVVGQDIFVSFSPERVDPGNPNYNTKNTPKVVGGVTETCTEVATEYYNSVVDKVISVSSTTAAEMVKLYENTFRAINIGLVNELAIICNLLGTDVWEIVDAAATKPFGFMPFYPGPGLGGHCIPVDPSYLAWRMRSLQYKTRFIDLATEINTHMPEWVIQRSMDILNEKGKSLNGSRVLLLGMAYKNDIDDLRESPALDIFDLLNNKGSVVNYHDPYCPIMRVADGTVSSVELSVELLNSVDLVIITTGHKVVDYPFVLDNTNLVFDTRNVTRDICNNHNAEVVFL